jgi:transposase-like protein
MLVDVAYALLRNVSARSCAKFWLKIMTELKNRGVADMLLVCCDGLKGFPEAIEAAFPRSTVQRRSSRCC